MAVGDNEMIAGRAGPNRHLADGDREAGCRRGDGRRRRGRGLGARARRDQGERGHEHGQGATTRARPSGDRRHLILRERQGCGRRSRSPGSRIVAPLAFPGTNAQWHVEVRSPVTVAGPRRTSTGFPCTAAPVPYRLLTFDAIGPGASVPDVAGWGDPTEEDSDGLLGQGQAAGAGPEGQGRGQGRGRPGRSARRGSCSTSSAASCTRSAPTARRTTPTARSAASWMRCARSKPRACPCSRRPRPAGPAGS